MGLYKALCTIAQEFVDLKRSLYNSPRVTGYLLLQLELERSHCFALSGAKLVWRLVARSIYTFLGKIDLTLIVLPWRQRLMGSQFDTWIVSQAQFNM